MRRSFALPGDGLQGIANWGGCEELAKLPSSPSIVRALKGSIKVLRD